MGLVMLTRHLLYTGIVLLLFPSTVPAQEFTGQWLDIGAYQNEYIDSGVNSVAGMIYPAILRYSGHSYNHAFWIGVKDWTDPLGLQYPYFVARIGPWNAISDVVFPTQNKLIGRFQDTVVEVNGAPSFYKVAILDEIDPTLPADRMIHNIHHTSVGITVERKIYAYANTYHDNYHIIEYTYCNTGNTDGDEDIELPDQTLNDIYFFWIHGWRAGEQAAWATHNARGLWGGLTMNDTVGDGHGEYPVEFTAQYAWMGHDPNHPSGFSNLGSPLFTDQAGPVEDIIAEGDSVGRLSGATMVGRSTLHADRSTTNKEHDRSQPSTMSFMRNNDLLTGEHATHEDRYELGILSRENPDRNPGCSTCFRRAYPHYADRVEPDGQFWNPSHDAGYGEQGGYTVTTAYGPFEMWPGECVNIAVADGVAGLSFDAATKIGQRYKEAGDDRDNVIIEYDADGDGAIYAIPFDYNDIFVGTEAQTKNQWVMSARDSVFQMFTRAHDLYAASNGMTQYPIPEPPRPPIRFNVWGWPDKIDLEWAPASDGPTVDRWEIYRTENRVDNLYVTGCLEDRDVACGYELVASLPTDMTLYSDTAVARNTEYYYYIEAIGLPQPVDPAAFTGTPFGEPLRSGRYFTQTYHPVELRGPPNHDWRYVGWTRVVPNPVNFGARESIRFPEYSRVDFVDVPEHCIIRIFTEIGELVRTIRHSDESYSVSWDLTTYARQPVVSGIYLAVIQDLITGERAFLKFTVIR